MKLIYILILIFSSSTYALSIKDCSRNVYEIANNTYFWCAYYELDNKNKYNLESCQQKNSVQERIDCFKKIIDSDISWTCKQTYGLIKDECTNYFDEKRQKFKVNAVKKAQEIIRKKIRIKSQNSNVRTIDKIYDLNRGELIYKEFARYVKVHVVRFFPILQKKINEFLVLLESTTDSSLVDKKYEEILRLVNSLESKYNVNKDWFFHKVEDLNYPLHVSTLQTSINSWDHIKSTINQFRFYLDFSLNKFKKNNKIKFNSFEDFYYNEIYRLSIKEKINGISEIERKKLINLKSMCKLRYGKKSDSCNIGEVR